MHLLGLLPDQHSSHGLLNGLLSCKLGQLTIRNLLKIARVKIVGKEKPSTAEAIEGLVVIVCGRDFYLF